VDHETEFDSLFEVNDSCADLLQHGHVERSSSDPVEWRAEIRRQARQDKIPVRTFQHGDHVMAVRTRQPVSDDEMRHAMKVMEIQHAAEDRARLLGHEFAFPSCCPRRAADPGSPATRMPRRAP